MLQIYLTLIDFIEGFFKWLDSRDIEGNHKTAVSCFKQSVVQFSPDSPEEKYRAILTQSAWEKHVGPAIAKCSQVKATREGVSDSFIMQFPCGVIKFSDNNCTCKHWASLNLPCKHILAARELLGMDLFDYCLVAERWTKNYSLGLKRNEVVERYQVSVAPIVTSAKKPKVKTMPQKSAIAAPIGKDLINTLLLASGATFDQMCEATIKMINLWKEGKQVEVSEMTEQCSEESVESSSEENDNSLTMATENDPTAELLMPTPMKIRGRPSGMKQTNLNFRKMKSKKSKA